MKFACRLANFVQDQEESYRGGHDDDADVLGRGSGDVDAGGDVTTPPNLLTTMTRFYFFDNFQDTLYFLQS